MADALEIVEGPESGRSFDLRGAQVIGRDGGSADIVISDGEVSRRHAEVSPVGDGLCEIRDLGSSNGTFVNDQPLTGSHRVRPGDEIRVGTTVLELRPAGVAAGAIVRSAPQVTSLGVDVLQPAAPKDLVPVEPEPTPGGLLAREGAPGYIDPALVGDPRAESPAQRPSSPVPQQRATGTSERLSAWIDSRVKRQTNFAAVSFLTFSALVVAIYFAVR